MNHRFKWIPDWKQPQFFPERLNDKDLDRKQPAIIFVGSMSDLIADVSCDQEQYVVKMIIEQCAAHPQHIFMFLTKRPENYNLFNFPTNVMLGATIESTFTLEERKRLHNIYHLSLNQKVFISVEPILREFEWNSLPIYSTPAEFIDLMIVGAMTGTKVVRPQEEWLMNILDHPNPFFKQNIRDYFPKLPKGDKQQIWQLYDHKL
jgi:protein gp37